MVKKKDGDVNVCSFQMSNQSKEEKNRSVWFQDVFAGC